MATKSQLEYFQFIYEKEYQIQENIINKGKVYLSIITLYFGVFIFKAKDIFLNPPQVLVSQYFHVFGLIFFILAFLLVLLSIGHFHKYERPSNLMKIINQFGDESEEDNVFFDNRMIDLAVATNNNKKKNNLRSYILFISSIFMGLGMVSHLCSILFQ